MGMECSIRLRRRARGVQLSDLRAPLAPPERGVAGIRRQPGVAPYGTELSCEWLLSYRIGLSLTQHIIHEIHHVTSSNRHTLLDKFATCGPRDISFEMLYQTSGFDLHGLGNGVHDVSLYSAMVIISSSRACTFLPRVSVDGGGERSVSNSRGSTKTILRACSISLTLSFSLLLEQHLLEQV